MSLPLIGDKVEEEAYISPEEALEYFIGELDQPLLKGVIICYDSQVLDLVEDEYDFEEENSPFGDSLVIQYGGAKDDDATIWL